MAALAAALLVVNAGARLDSDPSRILTGWRAWDDLAIAAGYVEQGTFPVAPYPIRERIRRDDPEFLRFREAFDTAVRARAIRPSRFWSTLAPGWTDGLHWRPARRFDDAGRAILLAFAFRSRGAVSPFLIAWLAVLGLVPLMIWIAAEWSGAAAPWAGAFFLAILGVSAFVLDTLALGYSAAGFHLLAVLVVAPVAIYSTLRPPTVRGVLVRAASAALAIAALSQFRNAAASVLPGLALATLVGALRGGPITRGRRWAVPLAATAGTIVVFAAAAWSASAVVGALHTASRARWRDLPRQHNVWITIWEGLGDFDRSKGHVFLDATAEQVVRGEGAPALLSPEAEDILRRRVITDIRQDPGWYAGILARRVWATVTLRKLWPWGAAGGPSMARSEAPEEGVSDTYYQLTAPADHLALGGRTAELPVPVVLLPTVALAAAALLPLGPRTAAVRRRARGGLLAVACVALGALTTPVLVTTASGVEPQMIVVAHVLAAAALIHALGATMRPPP